MTVDRKEFFSTKELRELHPELKARDDTYDGKEYVVFYNPSGFRIMAAPEWPSGVELWVEHEHERNVDEKIFDPLRFYDDRRGLTEALTSTVFGRISTMAECLTQHMFGGYAVDVMFGELIRAADDSWHLFVRPPSDVKAALEAGSKTQCAMIRVKEDKRLCATASSSCEPCGFLYHQLQFAKDGFRRYEFFLYPLLDTVHSAPLRKAAIPVKDYVGFYAAMYESCIMLAHHNQSRRETKRS